MEKFEIGDKVKIIRMDTRWYNYVPDLTKYLGITGIVKESSPKQVRVEFDDGDSWWFDSDWLKNQKGWTGKIIVVGVKPNAYYTPSHFTPGQVYTVEDGHIKITPYHSITPYLASTFEDIWNWFRGRCIEVLEFKGFCKNGKE